MTYLPGRCLFVESIVYFDSSNSTLLRIRSDDLEYFLVTSISMAFSSPSLIYRNAQWL
jgi:hypothetical protein